MNAVPESLIRKWVINADYRPVDQICTEISSWLKDIGLGEHIFPVQMLARESLNNAVMHGSALNQSCQVRAEIRLEGGFLALVVADDGPGFDWQREMNRELVESDKINGRGLWIYRLYADQIEFNTTGNAVKLTRFLNRNADGS